MLTHRIRMTHRLTLAEFVDQELQLADALFGGLLDAVLKQWRLEAPSRLASDMDALRVLHQHRQDFGRRAVQSMFEQTQRKSLPATAPSTQPARLELSLVDDDEVTADIEVARVVERANVELEEPLRELRTYTSALVGDVNTARDTNPLRPEVWVRAVMAAARSMPISRAMQIALLRSAAAPLIQALSDTQAAACARLRTQGVVPSAHRTVVNEGVTTELTEAMRVRRALDRSGDGEQSLPASVEELLQRLEQGLSARPAVDTDALRSDPLDTGMASASASAERERRTVERLSDLYDAILSDRRLPRETLPLLSRLYPAALRQTLDEPTLIDDASHPVWRFMDHLAFLVQTKAIGDAKGNIAFAQGLVEQLVNQYSAGARPFRSAADRLAVLERQRFARAVAAAAADIAALGADARDAGADHTPSVPLSLDAGDPESQPAPLRRGSDAEPTPTDTVAAWRAGSWLMLFLRGQWRRVLILWRAPSPGPLLLLDANEARHWALRPAALERLARAGLARTLAPRSLVLDASGRVGHVSRDPGPTLFG
ncbi:MAG: DUF1631 family protein [Burkholderiaceae bacterium]|nr:DUF1631 family protein [Burkholderiaceae bacterium]